MNADLIIKNAIPDASLEMISYIVWQRTPYPFGKITPKTLYKAADRVRRAAINNIRLCEFCDNMLQLGDRYTCKKCTKALSR
jgi:hypothetical protein